MRPSGPSPATCPLKQNGKRPSSKKRQMNKGKKATTMKRMKVSRSLRVRRTNRKRTPRMGRGTRRLMLRLRKAKHRLKLIRPSRLLGAMQLPRRKRRKKRRRRRKERRKKRKRTIMSMIAITMRRVATYGAPKVTTGSSITRRTKRPTKPVFRQCQIV